MSGRDGIQEVKHGPRGEFDHRASSLSRRHPDLLIGMCMDHRKDLTIPNEFAYVLRSAGANFRDSSFEISYAVAFVQGLVDRAGWTAEKAAPLL